MAKSKKYQLELTDIRKEKPENVGESNDNKDAKEPDCSIHFMERVDRDSTDDEHRINSVKMRNRRASFAPSLAEQKDNKVVFEDEEFGNENACALGVLKFQETLSNFCGKNRQIIKIVLYVILLLLFIAYASYAFYYNFDRSYPLLIFIFFFVFCATIHYVRKYHSKEIKRNWGEVKVFLSNKIVQKIWSILKWIMLAVLIITIIGYTIAINIDTPRNLISVSGMAVYIFLFWIFSVNPARVRWRPVIGGLLMQIIFALIILRTTWGFEAFRWLGEQVKYFLLYTDVGSNFLFGKEIEIFAFRVLPIVVFFSSVISVLYYMGVMQVVIKVVSKGMQTVMGTTTAESLNAAANIFVGQTEAPLIIRPMLPSVTRSELHAIMSGGFATIAGSVMGTYITFGVSPEHLLAASIMSAPAALAMSKLFYPETKKSLLKAGEIEMESSTEHNIVQAASNGASMSIQLIANIAVNLIAFLAILAFINAILIFLGSLVGIQSPEYEDFTIEFICSYLLWPFAFLMGAPIEDCRTVASLIGTKTVVNEFIAYKALTGFKNNRIELNKYITNPNETDHTYRYIAGDIYLNRTGELLKGGIISERGEMITTYALCGFANFGSIGIMLGLSALAPNRKDDLAAVVVRAMITGNVACFMTACIAGLYV